MSPFKSLYFALYLLVFILACGLLLTVNHGEVVLIVNANRNTFLDTIMPWVTYLGDGLFLAILIVCLLVYRWRLGLLFAIAGISQAFVTALLKRVVFGKTPRPTNYFESRGIELDLIDGIDYARIFSFPSGHTMTVFMMTALLAFTIVPRKWQVLLLLVALFVGFSRIYLLQHFYQDVVAGSLVGVLIAAVFAAKFFPNWDLKK